MKKIKRRLEYLLDDFGADVLSLSFGLPIIIKLDFDNPFCLPDDFIIVSDFVRWAMVGKLYQLSRVVWEPL